MVRCTDKDYILLDLKLLETLWNGVQFACHMAVFKASLPRT